MLQNAYLALVSLNALPDAAQQQRQLFLLLLMTR